MLCLKSLFFRPSYCPQFASPILAHPSKCHFWGFPINSRCSRAGLVAQWRCLALAGSQEPLSYFLFFNTPTTVYSVPTAGQPAVHLGDLQGHPLCQEGGHQPSSKPETALEVGQIPSLSVRWGDEWRPSPAAFPGCSREVLGSPSQDAGLVCTRCAFWGKAHFPSSFPLPVEAEGAGNFTRAPSHRQPNPTSPGSSGM